MSEADFPELIQAAKCLHLDAGMLAESLLCRLDAGEDYWSALRGVVAESMQRRGRYGGELKARIDSGDIFTRPAMPSVRSGQRIREAMADGRMDVLDALAVAGNTKEHEPCE